MRHVITHIASSLSPLISRSPTLWAAVCLLATLSLAAPAAAATEPEVEPSRLAARYTTPELASFLIVAQLTSPDLFLLLERASLDPHQDLHLMWADARRREHSKHWIVPTISHIGYTVTREGLVLMTLDRDREVQQAGKEARLLPTLSFSTVGAKLRVNF